MAESYIDAKTLASYLGVDIKTIYNKKSLKKIPYHTLPGSSRPRYRLSEVEAEMMKGRFRHKRRKKRDDALKEAS